MGIKVVLKSSQLVNEEGQRARVYFSDNDLRVKRLHKKADADAKPAFFGNFLLPYGCAAIGIIADAVREAITPILKEEKLINRWMDKNCGEGALSNNCGLRDGNERDEISEDFENHFFMNCKSYRPINIQSANGVKIGDAMDEDEEGDPLDESDIGPYSGAHLKALVLDVYGYDNKEKGVSISLLGLRINDDEAAEMASSAGETASDDDLSEEDDDVQKGKSKETKRRPPSRR